MRLDEGEEERTGECWTLSEFQEAFKPQYETELFIKHPLGVRKILKSYFKNN